MKKRYLLILAVILPFIILIGYYQFFYEVKPTNEESHITQLIEKLPEYIDLSKNVDGYIHIDFLKDTSTDIVTADILTFKVNSDPAKLIYRIQYNRSLDKITSVRKAQ